MTTLSIHNNGSPHIDPAANKIAGKKGVKGQDSEIKKDSVEISAQSKIPVEKDITYSPESIMNSKISPETFDYDPKVHNLDQIRQKISDGYYDSNEVINSVVNRISDNLE